MNIIILGAAGFIGTNLALELVKNQENHITLVDRNWERLKILKILCQNKVKIREKDFILEPDFEEFLQGQDMVYQLISTTVPANSNQQIPKEINDNVACMLGLLEACVKCHVKKIIYPSSGGTVYGIKNTCPFREDMETDPIHSYGLQKLMNEKLLYLYHYRYGLDYRIIRLANPYGPYQRVNGIQGVVTAFIYKALKGESICVYGDGSVVRDYIYIDDAIRAMIKITNEEGENRLFNVGSGRGVSISQLIDRIRNALGLTISVDYRPGRLVDVPANFLDISRYENTFGPLVFVPLEEGIRRTADHILHTYLLQHGEMEDSTE